MTNKFDKILSAVFGITFVTVLLIIALWIENPTDFQIFIFRVVLALAAAGVGAVIPGFIDIKIKIPSLVLRAGGAIALFVLIYFTNPPALIDNNTKTEQLIQKSE